MAQLAIRGHETRGKEVIEILEMLGGKNKEGHCGNNPNVEYYISHNNNTILCDCLHYIYTCVDYTLEEFLEKYPYKVGDKVYSIIHSENQTITNLVWDFQENEVVYKTNDNEYVYVNYLQPYKEETMEENTDTAFAPDLKGQDYSGRRFGYKIPNGYEFECVRKNEIILKPIKPQYPRDYDECCEVLSLGEDGRLYTKGYKASIIQDFQKLLICRDAYWMVYGEENKLGKPWEPDWCDDDTVKYCIIVECGIISKQNFRNYQCILAFPTEEMRDYFYENFKELIETCKEFL